MPEPSLYSIIDGKSPDRTKENVNAASRAALRAYPAKKEIRSTERESSSKARELVQSLYLADDETARIAFRGNPEAVGSIVHAIPGRDGISIAHMNIQEPVDSIAHHSVILDILANDLDGDL